MRLAGKIWCVSHSSGSARFLPPSRITERRPGPASFTARTCSRRIWAAARDRPAGLEEDLGLPVPAVLPDERDQRGRVVVGGRAGGGDRQAGRMAVMVQAVVPRRSGPDRRDAEAAAEVEALDRHAEFTVERAGEAEHFFDRRRISRDVLDARSDVQVEPDRGELGMPPHLGEGPHRGAVRQAQAELSRPPDRRDDAKPDSRPPAELPGRGGDRLDLMEAVDMDQSDPASTACRADSGVLPGPL